MYRSLFILLFHSTWFLPFALYGQPMIDSLRKEISITTDDTLKARLYNRLFTEVVTVNNEDARAVAQEGLWHTEKMNWPKGIAVFKSNIGQLFSNNGYYDSAVFYYEEALFIHRKNKDNRNIAANYNNMGSAAQNIRSDYASASSFYFKALSFAEEAGDTILITTCLNNIAKVYSLQADYSRSLAYANRAVAISKNAGNTGALANTLETIATIWYNKKQEDSARYYYTQAGILYEQAANTFGLASVLSNKALTYKNDYYNIIETRLRAQSLFNESGPMHIAAITNTGNLGIAYFDLAKSDLVLSQNSNPAIPVNKTQLLALAEKHLSGSIRLCEELGETDTRASFLGNLAELQAYKGDFKNAYFNFKTFSELMDSIYSQESKNKIATAASQRTLDIKDTEIRIKQLALQNQKKLVWGLAGGLLLFGGLGFLLYRQNKLRKKANQQLSRLNAELDQANKVKTKFFGILSHDLRGPIARLISFLQLQKENPGLLNEEQAAAHQEKITASAENLLENMETILLWSKGQMELFQPAKNEIEVENLFAYIRRFFQSVPGIQFRFGQVPGMKIMTDENYLQTIMQNLTANAVAALKNSPAGLIEWTAGTENNQSFLLICDNGPGLSPEWTASAEQAAPVIQGKSGLGLMIVKDLCKAIQCEMKIITNGAGTSIQLFFI